MVTFLFKYSLKTNSKLTLTPNHLTNNQGLVKYLLNFKHKGEPNESTLYRQGIMNLDLLS